MVNEDADTFAQRYEKMSKDRSVQDYVVIPNQLLLDGIASEAGKICQFVAMPFSTGYSIEQQVTGGEVTGGIQLK